MWGGHPAVLRENAMRAIGGAAAAGGQVPQEARRAMRAAALRQPLNPEPFLVAGTVAEVEGRGDAAEQLFLAARERDPRSAGARYFLADRYFRTGRLRQGIGELAALSRIMPGASAALAPALASFAAEPRAAPLLKRFFRSSPESRDEVLGLLSADPANAGLIVAISAEAPRTAPAPSWQSAIVRSLIDSGQPLRAREVWQRLAGVQAANGLFNGEFRNLPAPGPFNWTFASGDAGLVEPATGGGLQILYYGRADAVLASQDLLLAPGPYRLHAQAAGDGAALRWRLSCAKSAQLLAGMPVGGATDFTVPAGECPVQRIELLARAADDPRQVEVRVTRLTLDRKPQR